MAHEHVLNPGFVHLFFTVGWFLIDKDVGSKYAFVKIVDLVIILFLSHRFQSSDGCFVDDMQGSTGGETTLGVSTVVVENLCPWL